MSKITKETLISEVLNKNILTKIVFERYGMKCADCSMRKEETVEIGAKAHNVDVETLLYELNKFI